MPKTIIPIYTLISREVQRFMRVFVQSLVSPWINAVLYIFIFGFVVGSQIETIAGVRYIEFVLPGVLMLNLIASSFSQTSFGLYFQRFANNIQEILVAPIANWQILFGYMFAGILRAVIVGLGIYLIALLFGAASIFHFGWFLFYVIAVSIVFSFLGLLVGLWANNFEQLSILNTFVITPLTYLGGMFNSVEMLPAAMQHVVRVNPFFYFVSGLRYSMTGVQETSLLLGAIIVCGFIVLLGGITMYLFKIGWRIRG